LDCFRRGACEHATLGVRGPRPACLLSDERQGEPQSV